ncbi:exonuclease domain-containing protein [Devriesea agamarum]|uniref:exonuclease domain-containing protein n=1 Tax=Devriesea agamarum TaxID=472569 RepID=UPI00071DDA76|nr:exonuclease domain-containing protein [Devriesea agamarum]
MRSFVAIDFETANEQRSSACAIGLVRYSDHGEVEDRFYSLIHPHPSVDYFSAVNTWVHGITARDVAEAPQWSDIVGTVESFIEDKPIVAHNMAFDGYVLSDLAKLYELDPITNRKFCTVRLARRMLADKLERKSLDDVFDYYFPGESFQHHNATADAEACGRIFIRMQQDYSFEDIEQLCPVTRVRNYQPGPAAGALRNRKTVDELVEIYGKNKEALRGHHVVFTGVLRLGRRPALQELVRATGGMADKSITMKTTMLVVGIVNPRHWVEGTSASKKMFKASQLREAGSPIEVVTEEEFFNRLTDEQY